MSNPEKGHLGRVCIPLCNMSMRYVSDHADRFSLQFPGSRLHHGQPYNCFTHVAESRSQRKEEDVESPSRLHDQPPSIPRPRYLCIFFSCCSACFACSIVIVLTILHVRYMLPSDRSVVTPLVFLQSRPAETGRIVRFGLWDSEKKLTALHITLAISMSLGPNLKDDEIHVTGLGNFFFEATLQRGSDSLASVCNDPLFLQTLNANAFSFGGRLVVTNRAHLTLPPPSNRTRNE